jgi:hypothetical protein
MVEFSYGDIYKGFNIFSQESPDGKFRPLLYYKNEDGKDLFFKITSQYADKPDEVKELYYELIDWKKEGLGVKSYVDIIEAETFETIKEKTLKYVGRLTDKDAKRLAEFIVSRLEKVIEFYKA